MHVYVYAYAYVYVFVWGTCWDGQRTCSVLVASSVPNCAMQASKRFPDPDPVVPV